MKRLRSQESTASKPGAGAWARCPDCSLHALVPVRREQAGVEGARFVAVCPVCDGVWVDHEPGDPKVVAGVTSSPSSSHTCPRGHGPIGASPLTTVGRAALELCPVCRGLWFSGAARRELVRASGPAARRRRLELAGDGLVWAAQILTSLPFEPGNLPAAAPRRLYGVGVSLVVVYVASVLGLVYARDFALRPGALVEAPAELYTLLTHVFFHADWPHLLGNLYFFYVFGRSVEPVLGGRGFLALFFGAGVVGGLAQALLAANGSPPVLGASGAIAGIMGAHLWFYPRVRVLQVIPLVLLQIELPVWAYLGLWLGCQIYMVVSAYSVELAWQSHIAGFLCGLATTAWVVPWRRRRAGAWARDAASAPR